MTRTRTLALAGGAALYALALPPFDLWPLAWVALVPLVAYAERSRPVEAAALGAVAGFLTSWTVTWWLVQAISSYFAAHVLVGAAATCAAYVLAVSSTFACFAVLVSVGTRDLAASVRPVVTAALWVACEFVRARVLGDPWALLGYTQYQVLPVIQIASWTGVYGVSFLVALGNAGLAALLTGTGSFVGRVRVAALSFAVVGVVALGGAIGIRLGQPASHPALRVAVLQTNVPPSYTWDRRYAERQLRVGFALTTQALASRPALVVWPENSLPLYLEQEPLVVESLHRLVDDNDVDVLVGGPRHVDGRTYNSARLLQPGRAAMQVYDKQRLVPFAEAPPFRAAAGPPEESPRRFSPGNAPGLLHGRVALGTSICHEILYPETVHRAVALGAQLLVNIANDGWLDGGHGVASRQHFAMAVLRAVEARRSLVRASTTGPSGIVDPWGRIDAVAAPGGAHVVAASVALRDGTSPYVRFGDWFAFACLCSALAIALRAATARRSEASVPVPVPRPS